MPFEQPPYIVRRFAGKTKNTEAGEDNVSPQGSGDDDMEHGYDDGQPEVKFQKQARGRGQASKDQNNNGDQNSRKTSNAKDTKKEHKVVFDLRVR